MLFSIVHPSRNRLRLAEEAVAEWTGKFSGTHGLDYVLSIDADDDHVQGYRELAERRGTRLIVNRNRSIVDAVNRGAEAATGELLIVVSDDFGCPDRWDLALAAAVGGRRDVAVLVDDANGARIMTLPVIGRALYARLGYIYFPDYFSVCSDDDITEVAAALGKLIDARHLVFPHRHYSLGGNPSDPTYERQNSHRAYLIGWRILEKRRADGFGLRPWSPRVGVARLRADLRYFVRLHGGRLKRGLHAVSRNGKRKAS